MPYFNFNKVAGTPPNDDLVNESIQLNDNWNQLDVKLQPYISGGTISNLEVGQEYFDGAFNYAVWDGTAGRIPDDIANSWSAWTNIPVAAGRAIRTGFQPKWRNNPTYRMVELVGGFQYDGAASAWPTSNVVLNADSAGSPPLSMLPIGGKHVSPCAAALTSGTAVVAGGYVIIDAGTNAVRITARYMGGPGGGNFLMLDQVWWWY